MTVLVVVMNVGGGTLYYVDSNLQSNIDELVGILDYNSDTEFEGF